MRGARREGASSEVQIFTGWLRSRRGRGSASVGKSPGEDANSTTDKLARRTDDTCKIGRQEDAPVQFEFGARQMRFAQLVVELNFTRRQGE